MTINSDGTIQRYKRPSEDSLHNEDWKLLPLPAEPTPKKTNFRTVLTREQYEELKENVKRVMEISFEAGCRAVHENYQEDRDPDFTEAAIDFSTDALNKYWADYDEWADSGK